MAFTFSIPESVLPKGTKFKEGEVVDWGKKNLKEQTETEVIIDLAMELAIEPKAIFKHLKVNLGEMVKEGQLLAQKKGVLGHKDLKAPHSAEVRGINHEDGTLTLAISQITDVPFAIKATFVKKDKDRWLFKVSDGIEVPVQNSLETNFGGYCSYIHSASQISLESCEQKAVVTQDLDIMDQAKITALSPIAIISYEASYHDLSLPLLLLANKADWKNLFSKKWQLCLYLSTNKFIYFFNP